MNAQCRWYQIKITLRWEDSEYSSSAVGTPARVVQYEGYLLLVENVKLISILISIIFFNHPFLAVSKLPTNLNLIVVDLRDALFILGC